MGTYLAMDMNHQLSPSLLGYSAPDFDPYPFPPEDELYFQPPSGQILSPQLQLGIVPPPPPCNFSDSSAGEKATTPSSDCVNSEIVRKTAPKPRLERRGHTKSRRGCYNCKRRRIKCQETQPACGHCVKTGLKCEYPSLPQITHQPHNQIPIFSLQDMRLFQHFLTQCYPHHPLKQEEVWTHEVPCIAHNHEYLMHAILGFAASELQSTDSSLLTAAVNHRVKAIKAIKKRLADAARSISSAEETNAMIATCFALTFQSVSLDDGLAEFMTFIRGILIVGMQMMFRGIKPIFTTLMDEEQKEKLLEPLMETLPLIQRGWADSALEAIGSLRPLCIEQVQIEYYDKLMDIVQKLYISSWDAYKAHTQQYGWWMMLPHSVFQELISPDNQVILLLHTHWIALGEVMAFITQQEYEVREKHGSDEGRNIDPGMLRWLRYLNARVDYEHQMYNQWPMWVEAQLDRDLSFFGKLR
ncbi:unnamed protein product [Clonostachys chloroleuca]|uniref:Zn(2)-C6 fungal-type domain-containing protein n=1 Tax=Clonostachys chloroleuca TaxID=1926264 RepID=A0AA35QAK0_9HYPO|nr:unnamed protein product [Clonostachys chloroleuca]